MNGIGFGERVLGSGMAFGLGCALVLASAGCASSPSSTTPAQGMTVITGGPGGVFGGAGAGVIPNSGLAATASPNTTGTASQPMPCNVATAVAGNCQKCHGATPIGGAPMSLLTYDDFHKDHVVATTVGLIGQTKKVYELAKMRINDQAKPMPQGGIWAAATDQSVLNTWLGAGAPAGTQADKACGGAATPGQMTGPGMTVNSNPTGAGGSGAMQPMTTGGPGTGDGTYGPITAAPGEICYDLAVHGSTTSVDASPLPVATGEFYEQFYYKIPWPKGTQGTRYGTQYDNEKVLHHWLLFTSSSGNADGYHVTAPLPTLNGDNATLVAGWAVGGSNLALPSDAGFELPDGSGGVVLNAQWHFYNTTGTMQMDHSAIRVCTVPAGTRPHSVTITWIGNEDLNGNKWTGGAGMPAHQMSEFSGTCDPLREGMNATDPIHIIGFWPHMHQIGVRMEAVINHKGGMSEKVFDKPFDFNHQVHYLQNYDLMPGDTITANCFFNNTTNAGVPFGESSDTEMCYNFTMAWPAHSLENHVVSLIGASNTCW